MPYDVTHFRADDDEFFSVEGLDRFAARYAEDEVFAEPRTPHRQDVVMVRSAGDVDVDQR